MLLGVGTGQDRLEPIEILSFFMHDLRIAQKAPKSKIVTQIEPEFLMRSFPYFDGKRCLLKAEKMTDNNSIIKSV